MKLYIDPGTGSMLFAIFVGVIGAALGISESKVKMTLSRMRSSLYETLKKEGLL